MARRAFTVLDMTGEAVDFGCIRDVFADEAGSDVVSRDEPRGRGPFLVVKGMFARGDLSLDEPAKPVLVLRISHDGRLG